MKDTDLVINYDRSKMILHLDRLFPRTKGWLNEFEKKVLRYCPDREEVVDRMITYLRTVKIPGLPEELKALDRERLKLLMRTCCSTSRKVGNVKGRKARWDNYCKQHDMNMEVMSTWKPV